MYVANRSVIHIIEWEMNKGNICIKKEEGKSITNLCYDIIKRKNGIEHSLSPSNRCWHIKGNNYSKIVIFYRKHDATTRKK